MLHEINLDKFEETNNRIRDIFKYKHKKRREILFACYLCYFFFVKRSNIFCINKFRFDEIKTKFTDLGDDIVRRWVDSANDFFDNSLEFEKFKNYKKKQIMFVEYGEKDIKTFANDIQKCDFKTEMHRQNGIRSLCCLQEQAGNSRGNSFKIVSDVTGFSKRHISELYYGNIRCGEKKPKVDVDMDKLVFFFNASKSEQSIDKLKALLSEIENFLPGSNKTINGMRRERIKKELNERIKYIETWQML